MDDSARASFCPGVQHQQHQPPLALPVLPPFTHFTVCTRSLICISLPPSFGKGGRKSTSSKVKCVSAGEPVGKEQESDLESAADAAEGSR